MREYPSLPLGSVPYPWGMPAAFFKQLEHNLKLWGDFFEKLTLFQKALAPPAASPTPRP